MRLFKKRGRGVGGSRGLVTNKGPQGNRDRSQDFEVSLSLPKHVNVQTR